MERAQKIAPRGEPRREGGNLFRKQKIIPVLKRPRGLASFVFSHPAVAMSGLGDTYTDVRASCCDRGAVCRGAGSSLVRGANSKRGFM